MQGGRRLLEGRPKFWLKGQKLPKKNISKRVALLASEIEWKQPFKGFS